MTNLGPTKHTPSYTCDLPCSEGITDAIAIPTSGSLVASCRCVVLAVSLKGLAPSATFPCACLGCHVKVPICF